MHFPESLRADLASRPPATEERERVAAALCLHFAADNLNMDALEDRLWRVYVAQTPAQLQGLLHDLPPLDRDKLDAGDAALLAPSAVVPARGVLMAFMGGVARKGTWLIPRELKVWAFMGGAEIDLREGKFAPGVTQIDVTVFMGGVEITVPHGVRVEVMGGAFMGGFGTDAGDTAALDPSAPVLRVSGLAIMAGVEVKVRRPSKKILKRFEAAVDAAKRLPSG